MARSRNLQVLGVVWTQFGKNRGTTVAAALSYYLLFSIFPLTLFLVGLFSFFVDRETVKEEVITWLNDAVPLDSEGESQISDAIDGVIDARGPIAILGVVGLAWSAAAFFGALRTAVNDAFDVTQSRPFYVQKVMDIGGVVAVGLLFLLSILITFMLQLLRATTGSLPFSGGEISGFFWGAVAFAIGLVISFVAFTVIYKYVPNTEVKWRHAMLGAILPAVLFEVTKVGFSIYLSYFSDYTATYGAFGAVVAFLFWAYLTGVYLILGAELAAEYPRVQKGFYDIPDALRPPSLLDRLKARWARLRARFSRKPSEPPVEQHPGASS